MRRGPFRASPEGYPPFRCQNPLVSVGTNAGHPLSCEAVGQWGSEAVRL